MILELFSQSDQSERVALGWTVLGSERRASLRGAGLDCGRGKVKLVFWSFVSHEWDLAFLMNTSNTYHSISLSFVDDYVNVTDL